MNTLDNICCAIIAAGAIRLLFIDHAVPVSLWARTALYIIIIGASGVIAANWAALDWHHAARVRWWSILSLGMAMWLATPATRRSDSRWITRHFYHTREPARR
jgi:hypothetical protein